MKKIPTLPPKRISKHNKKYYVCKIACYFWMILLIILSSFFVFFYVASKGWIYNMPSTADIENPTMEVGSEIYDINNKLLGKFYYDNRILITYKQLPENFINALIAKEDIRFRDHSGIDGRSLLRAILFFGYKGGASTISQQLAKLLFTGRSSKNKIQRVYQKLLEWIMAIQLERRYSKEEIIAMYTNKFDFLNGAKGIESAAWTYFNKSASNLNLQESATLVGMFGNPYLYNPKIHPDYSKRQRNLVLLQMKKYNFISSYEYERSIKMPLYINFKIQEHTGLITYYTEFLKKEIEENLNELEKTEEDINLYTSGLKIYTSIDAKMQKYAESAVKKHLRQMQYYFDNEQKNNPITPFIGISPQKRDEIIFASVCKDKIYQKLKKLGVSDENIIKNITSPELRNIFTWGGDKEVLISLRDFIIYHKGIIQAGLISIEPENGYVKAWVGGVDFNHFQYDHVSQTRRQVGSVFKPILYAAVINKFNYNPCEKISGEHFELKDWEPRNASDKYEGDFTLKEAIAYSVNTVSARLIYQITPNPIIDLAKKMGIKSIIPNNLSIALGSADITPYEMTTAFNTFNNHGVYVEPHLLIRIEDRYGKIIKETHSYIHEVLNEETAFIMIRLMQGVVDFGTAHRLRQYNIKAEVAGKTGTTNDQADGWFIGMVPRLTTGIWVGWEDRFTHFKTLTLGQGSNMALPIWAYYMRSIYEDLDLNYSEEEYFEKPFNMDPYWDNCDAYEYEGSDNISTEYEGSYDNISTFKGNNLKIDQYFNQKDHLNYND